MAEEFGVGESKGDDIFPTSALSSAVVSNMPSFRHELLQSMFDDDYFSLQQRHHQMMRMMQSDDFLNDASFDLSQMRRHRMMLKKKEKKQYKPSETMPQMPEGLKSIPKRIYKIISNDFSTNEHKIEQLNIQKNFQSFRVEREKREGADIKKLIEKQEKIDLICKYIDILIKHFEKSETDGIDESKIINIIIIELNGSQNLIKCSYDNIEHKIRQHENKQLIFLIDDEKKQNEITQIIVKSIEKKPIALSWSFSVDAGFATIS